MPEFPDYEVGYAGSRSASRDAPMMDTTVAYRWSQDALAFPSQPMASSTGHLPLDSDRVMNSATGSSEGPMRNIYQRSSNSPFLRPHDQSSSSSNLPINQFMANTNPPSTNQYYNPRGNTLYDSPHNVIAQFQDALLNQLREKTEETRWLRAGLDAAQGRADAALAKVAQLELQLKQQDWEQLPRARIYGRLDDGSSNSSL